VFIDGTQSPWKLKRSVPWVSPGAGWWVAGPTGRAKQVRVLGNPFALHTNSKPSRVWGALAQLRPQTKSPGQLAAHIALSVTWGGLVGGRAHLKGQVRVLGSPLLRALH
jgi:hypothetical protein